jgi:CheY-like chemotaxis protein
MILNLKMMSVKTLIVDDDEGVIFLHELMIKESGFSDHSLSFTKAGNALQYLAGREEKDSDCVIFLDINMPGMNGWEFLECLEKESYGRNIYVVMATSSVNREDRIKADTFKHVVGFVEKPLNLAICGELKKLDRLQQFFTQNGN